MAQLLIIEKNQRRIFQPVASIRDYSEPDFEDKLLKYSKELFSNYYAIKFKFPIRKKSDIKISYVPDLLLISKSFKKWIIVEVELCKPDLSHTFKQIDCFLEPYFDADDVLSFLFKHNKELAQNKEELTKLIKTEATVPELLVIFDDYNDTVFKKINDRFGKLNICVLEVYREPGNKFSSYRLGGKYPYDVTSTSKLSYVDDLHYKIEKPEVLEHFEGGEIKVLFEMVPFRATLMKSSRKNGISMIKIVDHNFETSHMLQLAIDVEGQFIIQML